MGTRDTLRQPGGWPPAPGDGAPTTYPAGPGRYDKDEFMTNADDRFDRNERTDRDFDGPRRDGPRGHRGRGRGFDERVRRLREFGEFGTGGPGGPGFGPGGPGLEMFGPRGPGGRRAKRGDVRAAILSLLAEEPLNGYQLIKRIARNTGGVWRPSSGSVYPMLNQLVGEGLIESQGDGSRTDYRLTDSGRTYVGEHASELAAAWEVVDDVTEDMAALRESFGKTMGAMRQLIAVATDDQASAATSVLDETRRKLYQILAE